MITLLNDIRLPQGKSPLGFIDPLLYQMDSSCFSDDITEGSNCCKVLFEPCAKTGISAAKGWDPVTGLGSPNFAKMADCVSLWVHNPSPFLCFLYCALFVPSSFCYWIGMREYVNLLFFCQHFAKQ
jgi:hypothetical protein